jgi:uncharacterized protein YcnI
MKKQTRLAVSTAAAALAMTLIALPLSASAHVPVSPNVATAGGSTMLTFTVPNESATAGTVKVEIDLPTDHPFGSVTYQAIPGWTTVVVTSTLETPITDDGVTITEAPTSVSWTADAGTQISDGQFQEFVLKVSPVPNTGSVMFPVHQTYSDGTVADWVNPTPASGEEPESPAPTLYINDAPPGTQDAGTTASVTATSDAATATDSGSGSTTALIVGGAGLALGLIALVLAIVALRRRTSTK